MSVEITVDLRGTVELERKLERLDQHMRDCVDEALQSEMTDMCALARSSAPKRTGFLASTVFVERTGEWAFKLGARADYAYFVEFGTRFMRARRFLARTLENALPSLVTRVNEALRRTIIEASAT